MPRHLLVRLRRRLDASSLRISDPVRLDLERELVDLMAPATMREPPLVIVIHTDPQAETLPN